MAVKFFYDKDLRPSISFTKQDVIKFLEDEPSSKKYWMIASRACVIAEFFRFINSSYNNFYADHRVDHRVDHSWVDVSYIIGDAVTANSSISTHIKHYESIYLPKWAKKFQELFVSDDDKKYYPVDEITASQAIQILEGRLTKKRVLSVVGTRA